MSVKVIRKEPPQKKEPIQAIILNAADDMHCHWARLDLGNSSLINFGPSSTRYGRDDASNTNGHCSFSVSVTSVREYANALLELCDQVEGK